MLSPRGKFQTSGWFIMFSSEPKVWQNKLWRLKLLFLMSSSVKCDSDWKCFSGEAASVTAETPEIFILSRRNFQLLVIFKLVTMSRERRFSAVEQVVHSNKYFYWVHSFTVKLPSRGCSSAEIHRIYLTSFIAWTSRPANIGDVRLWAGVMYHLMLQLIQWLMIAKRQRTNYVMTYLSDSIWRRIYLVSSPSSQIEQVKPDVWIVELTCRAAALSCQQTQSWGRVLRCPEKHQRQQSTLQPHTTSFYTTTTIVHDRNYCCFYSYLLLLVH